MAPVVSQFRPLCSRKTGRDSLDRHTNGSSLNRSQQLKPFCKICFDTGKAESMYANHFVRETRDPNSRIVCPTLLALECRYCFSSGHTVSKCPKLENTKTGANVLDAPLKKNKKCVRICCDDQSSCSSNGFSMLYSSDGEDEDEGEGEGEGEGDTVTVDVTETSSEVFPCLAGSFASVNEVSNKTYAAALMAVLSGARKDEIPDDVSCVSSISGTSCEVKVNLRKVFAHSMKKYSAPGSWANDSDSDDEA